MQVDMQHFLFQHEETAGEALQKYQVASPAFICPQNYWEVLKLTMNKDNSFSLEILYKTGNTFMHEKSFTRAMNSQWN